MSETERTRLLHRENIPQYAFETSISREKSRQMKRFQCCLCASFICIFLAAIFITIFYTISQPRVSNNSTNESQEIDEFNDLALFTKLYPLPDCRYKSNDSFGEEEIASALSSAKIDFILKNEIEHQTPSLPIHSPSYRHQRVTATSKQALVLATAGYLQIFATKHLFKNSNSSFRICNLNVTCENYDGYCNRMNKFRSYNGSCNNLINRSFGVAFTPFRRVLRPEYEDGLTSPRGGDLPSARTVSLTIHRPYYRNDPKFTVMLAVFGQFLDHDITATALSQKQNGSSLSCCHKDIPISSECFPVMLSPKDPFQEYNVSCIEFVRSAPAPTCCWGPREQMNQVSAFIDGSVIYGSTEATAKNLRTFKKGLLKMYLTKDNRTLLPISEDLNDGCNREKERSEGRYCFATGDARANENLHLTTMHLIWARHHNKIATVLTNLNPNWDDERLFQEARRIVGAQLQHITYNEFLPVLFGRKILMQHNLLPQTEGYFNKYNNNIDASIANNFATAAFRFAHTLIPGIMKLIANDSSSPEYIQMHKMLFNPFRLYQPGEMDRILNGALNTSVEASDAYFTNELKLHMFENAEEKFKSPSLCGLDLVSLNIQRGRDHGLPGYVKFRHLCGLKPVGNFEDLEEDFDKEALKAIQTIYRKVEDIDLYTGLLSEKPLKEGILGPTITCLIMDQFVRLKFGDRFFYEIDKHPQAFNPTQLKEIRKTTLAYILCENGDNLEKIQPLVMEATGKENNLTDCEKIPKINYSSWKIKTSSIELYN